MYCTTKLLNYNNTGKGSFITPLPMQLMILTSWLAGWPSNQQQYLQREYELNRVLADSLNRYSNPLPKYNCLSLGKGCCDIWVSALDVLCVLLPVDWMLNLRDWIIFMAIRYKVLFGLSPCIRKVYCTTHTMFPGVPYRWICVKLENNEWGCRCAPVQGHRVRTIEPHNTPTDYDKNSELRVKVISSSCSSRLEMNGRPTCYHLVVASAHSCPAPGVD